ncbi:ArsR family transcriptional regulator [Deinococcus metallilatus]|uniref:DNA-binding transcriptional ArsR family regulator n=1 Tax=Deinococcus metallilatus TaxID=1211322 RepID=A0AAJ5F2Y9_9DEIO|nr:winged helix-turn-helix domain-containing protein [Deinococcus metallilatus]MBB5295469.1 DNA-binding transcriptional ArsR family regulator [Deinococcus metallilatus]QBY08013.1 ArsR family transcriptional regulator [Deinococcus metallilatus]RXJ12906.1 ArsR family transcriptional regulator [Deinococcus metallilatus]TLK27171.1 winged helix-turn-helix transcriptional regulator [Deinococcus metallilatus]GMA16147.1 putative HTH-type transcriptional regulator YdfF [Deinococcus metallilatus]
MEPAVPPGVEARGIARIAALIGDPTRAAILLALADGQGRPAGELAWQAGVQPQTASEHLGKLREAGLVTVERVGRHRYYLLSGTEAASLLEDLAAFAPPPPRARCPVSAEGVEFGEARTCYDHLAGQLGVKLTAALVERGWLVPLGREFEVTARGERGLAELGVDALACGTGRRLFARRCLDRTERRPHVGGALGAALLEQLLALGWLVRVPERRVVRLTVAGRQELSRRFGVELAGVGVRTAAGTAG